VFDLRPQPPRTVALLGLAVAACAVALAGCGGAAQDGSSQTGKGSADQRSAGSGNSDGFEAPAGDNGIQEFGKEVAGSDLRQADEAVAALFRAVRSNDWSAVCARYLSRQNVEAFKKLAKMTPHIKGASCPKVLGRLNSTGEKPSEPKNGLRAIRIEGDRGFGLYRGTDGNGYAIAMKKEDGRWKLNALRPTPLEP
jgi:hypothetical protein